MVCNARSVRDDEGAPNVLWVVDRILKGEEMFAEMENGGKLAAAVFRNNPEHRCQYSSGMERDEALLFKFHDNDRSGAWRVLHSAFRDANFEDANVRESIECRTLLLSSDGGEIGCGLFQLDPCTVHSSRGGHTRIPKTRFSTAYSNTRRDKYLLFKMGLPADFERSEELTTRPCVTSQNRRISQVKRL